MGDRSGVYKISMVRMYQVAVLTNFRMYGSRRISRRKCGCRQVAVCAGVSKICLYENPYNVTGIVVRTGSKGTPTDICTDRNIGTWKGRNMERVAAQ